ncbi:hypothetical protein AB6H35_26510 [Citrobacter freundii]|uniref:hypothetical protein n=1 Tax=Citrobacter freundii TaxID=546 RepID=UPI0034DD3C10
MELPNIMHPVAKLSTALAAALMLSGCMPGEIRPTIGQQMETGDQRFGDLKFSASSHRMSGSTLPISRYCCSGAVASRMV